MPLFDEEPQALIAENQKYMRAILLTGHGGLDKLEYRDNVARPVAVKGEALIRVLACGLNNTDISEHFYSTPREGNLEIARHLNQIV